MQNCEEAETGRLCSDSVNHVNTFHLQSLPTSKTKSRKRKSLSTLHLWSDDNALSVDIYECAYRVSFSGSSWRKGLLSVGLQLRGTDYISGHQGTDTHIPETFLFRLWSVLTVTDVSDIQVIIFIHSLILQSAHIMTLRAWREVCLMLCGLDM